jgi:hypothetical protein
MVIMVLRQRVTHWRGRDGMSTLSTHVLILVIKPTMDEGGNKKGENVNLLSSIVRAGNDFMQHGNSTQSM